jgi:sarcosine oxidase gamma subunit
MRLIALAIGFALVTAPSAAADRPVPRRNPHRPLVTVLPMPEPDRCTKSPESAAITLRGRYGEIPIARGDATDGTRVVLWLGPRSWTITATMRDGRTCPLVDGSWWQFRPAPRPERPA